jgi:hypothetical protein
MNNKATALFSKKKNKQNSYPSKYNRRDSVQVIGMAVDNNFSGREGINNVFLV